MPGYDLTKLTKEELLTLLSTLDSKKKLLESEGDKVRLIRIKVNALLSLLSIGYLEDPAIKAQIDRLQYNAIENEIEAIHLIERLT